MGYRIQYEPELNRFYPERTKNRLNNKFLLYACALITILLLAATPVSRHWIWEFLIPGDAKITTAAFSQLLNQLGEGTAISEAVSTFCKEILLYA